MILSTLATLPVVVVVVTVSDQFESRAVVYSE